MGRKVGILLPRTGVYPNLGTMLADVFSEMNWRATVGHRATDRLLECDLLLFAGQCGNIDGLPKILRKRRNKRPATILWQLEPLPPPELSPEGETTGLRASAFDWGRMPRPARRVLNLVVPFRTKLFRAVQRRLAQPYSRRVVHEPNHQGWGQYDPIHYVMAMSEWRWIQRACGHGWIDHCFASNSPRVNFLRSRGLRAEMAPVGSHPLWGRNLRLTRDTDVLFLGRTGRDPRGVVLQWLSEQLAQRGRQLTFVRGAYGAVREEWLNRARIVLSLLRLRHDLAGMRVLMGLACGALVVSEQCADTGAFRPGEHFVMAEPEQMPEVIEHYLNHEDEREKIARRGRLFVTRELTLARVVHRMLKQSDLWPV